MKKSKPKFGIGESVRIGDYSQVEKILKREWNGEDWSYKLTDRVWWSEDFLHKATVRKATRQKTVFKCTDRVICNLFQQIRSRNHPIKIEVEVTEEDLVLIVGTREWQWDRRTGKMVAARTIESK